MPQPYPGQHWKHGWHPLTPEAEASKAKMGPPPDRPKSAPKLAAPGGRRKRTVADVVSRTKTPPKQDAPKQAAPKPTPKPEPKPAPKPAAESRPAAPQPQRAPERPAVKPTPAPAKTAPAPAPKPAAKPAPKPAAAAPTAEKSPAEVSRMADDAIRRAAGRKPAEKPAEKPADKPTPTVDKPAASSGSQVTGRSSKPAKPNQWGSASASTPGAIVYHGDGRIGGAVKSLGDDANLDVDGDRLDNRLGLLATDAVAGRKSSQQVADEIKAIGGRLPEGSRARKVVDRLAKQLDAPKSPTPDVPDGAPAAIKQLVQDLHAVPAVRRDPDQEMKPLLDIAAQSSRVSPARLARAVQQLLNKRHESEEGKAEIDRAVNKALKELR